MAFLVDDRVKVSDQSSQHRNHLGVVLEVLAGDEYGVRLDGHADGAKTTFPEDELQISTQPVPITY